MANSTIPVVLDAARANTREWPRRYTVVVLFALATALCYIDRVNISIAIIPLARAKGYDAAAKGLLVSLTIATTSAFDALAMAAGARHEALRAGLESLLHRGPELPFHFDSITR